MRTIIKSRRDTRHGLHMFLTFITCGLWAITGWPIATLWNKFGPRKRTTMRTQGHE